MKYRNLAVSIVIPVGIGALAAFFNRADMPIFESLIKPPGTPSARVFPIVWTILYVLMGISAYWVNQSYSAFKQKAINAYIMQLALNFLWPFFFFKRQLFLEAFVLLAILWVTILRMIILFAKVDKKAAILQIPYLLWVTYAGYLNFAIYWIRYRG